LPIVIVNLKYWVYW